LAEIEGRLTVLGDPQGAAAAAELLGAINRSRTAMAAGIALLGVLLACLVLVRRVRGVRELPAPEARLQT
jgi:hypothetical protein